MQKLFELKIATDKDLIEAIKELSWQGNNAVIRARPCIVEIWGELPEVKRRDTPLLNLPLATAELSEGYSADV